MDSTPPLSLMFTLLGVLIGASLGALITSLHADDFREEAENAFAKSRVSGTPADSEQLGLLTKIIRWTASGLRVEWIIRIFCLWIVLVVVFSIFVPVSFSIWFRSFFVGTLIGFAAAPWIWLHFSRTFSSSEERNRYQFLTVGFGVVLLAAILGPRVLDLLGSANKLDLFGISIGLFERERGTSVSPVVTTGPGGNSAIGQLTENTYRAMTIGNPGDGESVATTVTVSIGRDLNGFERLSTWDKDSAFIAYFDHAARKSSRELRENSYTNLWTYISDSRSELTGESVERDQKFINYTAPLFRCLHTYAKELEDIHLYFIDTSKLLKEFTLLLPRREQDSTENKANRTDDQIWPQMESAAADLVDSARNDISRKLPGRSGRQGSQDCYNSQPGGSDYGGVVKPIGATPYPVMLLAFSLAAVGSPESSIIHLQNWLLDHLSQANKSLALRWYIVRVELELAQMTTKYILSQTETDRLFLFERQLTDDMGALLKLGSPGAWNELCRAAKGSDLHARLSRWLAFTYAPARSYVFEIETPAVIDQWRRWKRAGLTTYLRDDLTEAVAFASSTDCFVGVPYFDRYKRQWTGQFELNIAQLRLDSLPDLSADDRPAEWQEIKRLLKAAQDHLGPVTVETGHVPSSSPSAVEELLRPDPFDDQRARVDSVRNSLDKSIQSR